MQRHLEARNRIFTQHQLAGMRLVSRRIIKVRWTKHREVAAAAVVRNQVNDPRPFADLKIKGERVFELLDTGASVSLLGRGCRMLLQRINVPMTKYFCKVRTAA